MFLELRILKLRSQYLHITGGSTAGFYNTVKQLHNQILARLEVVVAVHSTYKHIILTINYVKVLGIYTISIPYYRL